MNIEELNELLRKIKNAPFSNDDPKELLTKKGIDVENFDISALIKKLEELYPAVLDAKIKILNPDNRTSKRVEDFSKIIKPNNNSSEQDLKLATLHDYFLDYFNSEKEELGKCCFHYAQLDCCDKIIDAHSLQENGILNNIALKESITFSQKNGVIKKIKKGSIITFEILNSTSIIKEAKFINKKRASTFKGFCHTHDGIFQKTIEKYPFDSENIEHLFLHSYRSFAYSYHKNKELKDSLNHSITSYKNLLDNLTESTFYNSLMKLVGSEMPSFDLEEGQIPFNSYQNKTYKNRINTYLKNKSYNNLDFVVYKIPYKIPIAVASSFQYYQKSKGVYFFIPENNEIGKGYPVMITLLPEKENTSWLILARFKDDVITEGLFNELRNSKSSLEFELKISSMILRNIDNIYCSPDWWYNKLGDNTRGAFLDEINKPKDAFMAKSYSECEFNIFNEDFKI